MFGTDCTYQTDQQRTSLSWCLHRFRGQSGGYLASGMPLGVFRCPGRPDRADIRDATAILLRRNMQKRHFHGIFGAMVARTREIYLPMA